MKIQVPTNHNYFGEQPLKGDAELKEKFNLKRASEVKAVRNDLFGTTYELTTKRESLEQVEIFGFKNKRNKLEEEEQLILKLYSKEDQQSNRQYYIQTGLFAGVIYHKNCQFNITPAYGNLFLRRMLNYVNDIYVDTKEIGAQESNNANAFQQILAYLFIQSLERSTAMGLPQAYQEKRYRGVKVRGKIDVNEYLRRDVPFQGKLTTSFRARVYVQEIIDVLYLACRKLNKSFGKEIHAKIHGTYQFLKEHFSGVYPTQQMFFKAKNNSALLNPIYVGLRKTLDYAEIILKDLDIENAPAKKDKHTHGYLFDISQLFEVYLEKLLSRNFEEWIVLGQEELTVYSSAFYKRKMFPDIVMRHKYTGEVIVFDAKFKKMRLIKKDLDRSDFYQIHSYIQYYQPEVIFGGLLYPLSKEQRIKDCYADSLFEKGMTDEGFVVEGIYIKEEMDMSTIVENENAFINRIKNLMALKTKKFSTVK